MTIVIIHHNFMILWRACVTSGKHAKSSTRNGKARRRETARRHKTVESAMIR